MELGGATAGAGASRWTEKPLKMMGSCIQQWRPSMSIKAGRKEEQGLGKWNPILFSPCCALGHTGSPRHGGQHCSQPGFVPLQLGQLSIVV